METDTPVDMVPVAVAVAVPARLPAHATRRVFRWSVQ